MKIINISNTNIRINENCYLYDDGTVEHVDIVISAGVHVEYCFIETPGNLPKKYSRHIAISQDSVFTGTGVIMDSVDFSITTEIIWDNANSTLDLLALATNNTSISIEGIAKVSAPYRHISTRVDQTNILIGTWARVRGVPRLEIATDDITGGHSCRIHRLGGEALFYLTSRGLSEQSAETLLLNSEILRHIRTIEWTKRDHICREIHKRLSKK